MRKRKVTVIRGEVPLTDTMSCLRIEKKRAKINREKEDIDKCLNCTKEKCKRNCELIKGV